MDARLPAHLEVAALRRAVEAAGGFATVLRKGERDGGTILAVLAENGANARLFERMPSADGTRKWVLSRSQDTENPMEFHDYLTRRGERDPDLWIVELDIADGERLIALL
ncbi:DUF1491 family protein [Novosphingobium sp.]|uniref:DUF1491 family protein n=1 Tax=Novosphingobium sp. TaxID=1874826 RepID=UPI001ED3BDC3|nr:DUF1491 family protein [Novosphingobium sp.]MBK6802907.1 DUF1491 family protein [Novosphingobium sp.]MBK9012245.1 DUF1491 family protein [Novosphingobium sp.]